MRFYAILLTYLLSFVLLVLLAGCATLNASAREIPTALCGSDSDCLDLCIELERTDCDGGPDL